MPLLKLVVYGVLFTLCTFAYSDDLITIGGKICIGVLCKVSSEVAEGQRAIVENVVLHEQNQTLQSSLEKANTQIAASQATQAAQTALIGSLTNNVAAAHTAKQQVEAASAKALKEVGEKLYNALQQVSIRDVAIAALGTTLAIGVTAAVAYAVYRGVSSYMHNKSKTAAHQQLKACTEGDPASWAQNRNCEKQFHEFAEYAQGKELLCEQERFSTRMRTS